MTTNMRIPECISDDCVIYFDDRWGGEHGIGRVANELKCLLNVVPLGLSGSPVSPIDPLRLSLKMCTLPKKSAVFNPGFNAPLCYFRTYVFFLHDLNHIDFPGNSSTFKKLYYSIILKRACKFAYRVLTVSDFSRSRILAWGELAPEKVINVGNGVNSRFSGECRPFDPGYPYMLCVSNRKPHKNEKRIIEALAEAHIDNRIRLLFTGSEDDELVRLADKLNVLPRIEFLGRVSEENLPSYYRGALALVFPSLYEGFGLPVIEAMACGTPVLTSSTTSLPEVAGGAALLVNPLSVPEIACGIKHIVRDEVAREQLRTRGFENVKKYDWKLVAQRINNVFADLATKKK